MFQVTRVLAAIVLSLTLAGPCLAGSWGSFTFGQNVYGHFLSLVGWVDMVPSLSWSTNAWEFGNVDVGSTATKTFTITNSGNDIAEDVATTITGAGFRIYSSTTFGSISAGRTRTAKLEFKPTAGGAFPGFLNYSAPNIGRTSVALSGTGVGAALPSVYSSTSGPVASNLNLGDLATGYYVGQKVNAAQASHTLNRWDFYVNTKTGNVSGKTFRAYVYSASGDNMSILKATSTNSISGATVSNGAFMSFTFDPVSLNAGDIVVVSMNEVDAANYLRLGYSSTDIDGGYSKLGKWYVTLTNAALVTAWDLGYKAYE